MKTKDKTIHDEVYARLKKAGYDARIVSISRLADLEEAIKGRNKRNEFDPVFYSECLAFFQYRPSANLKNAASIIIVSVPQPIVQIMFIYKGKARPVFLPPTYIDSIDAKVKEIIAEALLSYDQKAERALLPVKTLAIRSGLAEYGKNNIAYHPANGSFHRLVSFYSDLACDQDAWREPVMMKQCEKCRACIKNCPTKAITEDRFLIRAHMCLTYHNEHEGGFPGYIDPSIHKCIVGCMRCQDVCPVNKDVRNWTMEGGTFDEKETLMILQGESLNDLTQSVIEKLERLCLIEYFKLLPRNLRAVLQAGS